MSHGEVSVEEGSICLCQDCSEEQKILCSEANF